MTNSGKGIIVFFVLCFVLLSEIHAQQAVPDSGQQIKAAVMTAPKALQAGAKVYGYNQDGEWTTLREGQNAIICIADNPDEKNFHVACYHKELEPFMRRGRELRKQGFTRIEVDEKRKQEIESGSLSLPRKAMTLYSLSAQDGAYDYNTGTLTKGQSLTVVYVPYGTQESTGMATSPPGPGAPWLMEPGTPWAHIMIPGKSVAKEESSK